MAAALLAAMIFMRHNRQMRLEGLRNERLRHAQADLAHMNRVSTMGELTASLAHDIKQPIAAALLDAKSCIRQLKHEPSNIEEAESAAARMVNSLNRASEIVGRIGRLFKKDTLQRELVDINELVTEMADLMRTEAVRHGVSVRLDLEPALPQIVGDRVGLQQVLLNLMLNGIEAIRDTGSNGILSVKSRLHDESALTISISDTGAGVCRRAGAGNLQNILHDEAIRDRHGTVDQPLHYRGTWGTTLGDKERAAWGGVSLHNSQQHGCCSRHEKDRRLEVDLSRVTRTMPAAKMSVPGIFRQLTTIR